VDVKTFLWRDMNLRQTFALNLRRLRHERGFTQESLAHDAGVDRSHLGQIERGTAWVGLEIVEKLCQVLEVDPAEFFRAPTPRKGKR
jgi:transcriptional regulator with XRE-family HTH domain